MEALYPVFASVGVMLTSLVGALFAWKVLGAWLANRLRFLVATAAGVFIVIIYGLLTEALLDGIETALIVAFILGGLILEVATRLLPKDTHHHHGAEEGHTHQPIDARRMLLGDALHNIHDGLVLVPAFLVSPVVGFGTTVGILLHELVQEMAEFFVLREAGHSVRKALTFNFLVSSTILIGAGIALFAASFDEVGHLLVAFSAGGFSYILLRDLLPSIIRHARSEKRAVAYGLAVLVGALLMLTVSMAFPHEHYDKDELPLPEGFGLA